MNANTLLQFSILSATIFFILSSFGPLLSFNSLQIASLLLHHKRAGKVMGDEGLVEYLLVAALKVDAELKVKRMEKKAQ